MKDIKVVLAVFSKRLKELMKKEDGGKMTTTELADKCGLPRTTISGWVSGKRCPTIYSAYVLAEYFHVSLDYLIGRKDFE